MHLLLWIKRRQPPELAVAILYVEYRSRFEFARVDARHPLWRRARRLSSRGLPPLWARRSLFTRGGRPLMLTEVFLPALLELAS